MIRLYCMQSVEGCIPIRKQYIFFPILAVSMYILCVYHTKIRSASSYQETPSQMFLEMTFVCVYQNADFCLGCTKEEPMDKKNVFLSNRTPSGPTSRSSVLSATSIYELGQQPVRPLSCRGQEDPRSLTWGDLSSHCPFFVTTPQKTG